MNQFIYVCIILALNSCVDQNTPSTTFSLINNSSHNVTIEAFSRNRSNGELKGGFIKADVFEIEKNSNKNFVREQRDNRTFYSIDNVDSIKLVFGNSKFLTIDCNDWPSMENCNTIFRGDSNYQHFITEEDYESAIACNEDCE